MKKYTYYIIAAIVIFLVGIFVGSKSVPPEIVEKKVEVVKTVVQKDVKTVIKRVKTSDGTVTTEIVKEDKSNSQSDTTKASETIVKNEKQWKASLFTTFDTNTYMAGIERRIIGPVFMGAWGSTKGNAGVSISIEF